MKDYLDNRRKQKLYRQWVEKSGLPQESVPGDLEHEDLAGRGAMGSLGRPVLNFQLTMRHLLYLVFIIVILLISTIILAAALIMRSC